MNLLQIGNCELRIYDNATYNVALTLKGQSILKFFGNFFLNIIIYKESKSRRIKSVYDIIADSGTKILYI